MEVDVSTAQELAMWKHATLASYPDKIVGITLVDEEPGMTGIYVRDPSGGLWPARTVDRSIQPHHDEVVAAWLQRPGQHEDRRRKVK